MKETSAWKHGLTLTHIDVPNGEDYAGSPNPALNDLHLRVSHEKLPGLVWNLMIPENFLGNGKEPYTGFRPVVGMTWEAATDALFFDGLHYRANIDLTVSTRIQIESPEAIHYCVRVRNETDRPIQDVNFNACFNHHLASGFGEDVFMLGPDGWTRTFDLEGIPDPGIPYFVVADKEEAWRQAGQEKEHYESHPTFKPVAGLSATTGACDGLEWTLAHGSPQAALLWHNPKNPCTDLWHWIGTVQPGEERASVGRLYFVARRHCLDELLARFRTDAWLTTA